MYITRSQTENFMNLAILKPFLSSQDPMPVNHVGNKSNSLRGFDKNTWKHDFNKKSAGYLESQPLAFF